MIDENTTRRFWKYVEPAGEDECWEWHGSRDQRGYGKLARNGAGGTPHKAYRVSWRVHKGEIPGGLSVCHKCDNPPCVNPNHLFLGTHYENMQDAKRKGRMANNGPLPGEDNPAAKLSWDDVRAMRKEYENSGVTRASLAAKYGVAPGTVGKIIRNQLWEDVNYKPIDGNKKPRPHRKKFTTAQALEIRWEYEKGRSIMSLARQFKSNKVTVNKIIRGEYVPKDYCDF